MSTDHPLQVQKPGELQQDLRKQHSKPVLESHLVLLHTSEFSDITFIVGKSKERIPCHQLFLKARSPVFKAMFHDHWNKGSKDITLEDTDPKIFHKFLEFIYADIFVASVSEALKLLQVAQKYDVQLLVSKCEQVLDSHVLLDDAIDVFQVARKYEMTQLMNKVGDLMVESLTRLQFLPSFSRIDKQTFMYMLKRNDLKMAEIDLFHLAMKWSKNQSDLAVGKTHMEDILLLIRFPLMTLEEFTKVVVPTGVLSKSAVIEVFTYFGTDPETTESMAGPLRFSTRQRAFDNGKNQVCGLSIVSVPLYSADFANCRSRQERHEELTEHLEFEIGVILGGRLTRELLLGSLLVTSEEAPKQKIIRFTVTVESQSAFYDGYNQKIRRVQPDVEMEEGKMVEVKLVRQVTLRTGQRFCIVVRESIPELQPAQTYDVRDCGDVQENIAATIGDTFIRFEKIQRKSSVFGLPQPNLIYELGLKEL